MAIEDEDRAYRAHVRAMGAARQAAESRRRLERSRDPETRKEAAAALQAELARLDSEHRAWLREHGIVETSPPRRRRRRAGDAGVAE